MLREIICGPSEGVGVNLETMISCRERVDRMVGDLTGLLSELDAAIASAFAGWGAPAVESATPRVTSPSATGPADPAASTSYDRVFAIFETGRRAVRIGISEGGDTRC
jgi:hypothetical protein